MSDAAITSIVTGAVTVVTIVVTFLTLWVKLRYGVEEKANRVEKKLDNNTTITATAARKADSNTSNIIAATAAVDRIDKKLNGGIDASINQAIDPIKAQLDDHAKKIEALDNYAHKRNHDILTVLQAQSNKLESVIQILRNQTGK